MNKEELLREWVKINDDLNVKLKEYFKIRKLIEYSLNDDEFDNIEMDKWLDKFTRISVEIKVLEQRAQQLKEILK